MIRRDLDWQALHLAFRDAVPFPHVVVDDFFEPAVAEALAEIERRGRERFQAFAARADKLGGDRWELTIDPL
jgi:hypothetical protein